MGQLVDNVRGGKLLFVHDHKFRNIDGKIYSIGGLTDDTIIRYTSIFDEVTILARIIDGENLQNRYSEITNKEVQIISGIDMSYKSFEYEVKKADFVISRMPSFYGLKAIKLAKKLRKPYLIEMVGCPWDALWNHSIKGKLIAPYMTIITKFVVKKSPYVIYVTNKFLQKRYPSNGETINCSNVALEDFNENILEKRILKISSPNSNKIIGTTAAVDVKYKGQQYIIQALGKLKKQGYINFTYQLVGSGNPSYLKNIAIKNNVANQIEFLGTMPHKEVFNWLDTIDIYAQPSRQEGLPRALIESMSRGLPAFGAKTAGIPELLSNKYIFSNTFRNINEICKILKNFDKQDMLKQAQENYIESKNYDKAIIEARRKDFLIKFINSRKK